MKYIVWEKRAPGNLLLWPRLGVKEIRRLVLI